MARWFAIVVVAVVPGWGYVAVRAQSDHERPRFETASVRMAGGGRPSMVVTPGGLTYTNVTLKDCLVAAFGLEPFQVSGPSWIDKDRFAITARMEVSTGRPEAMRMLQSLLLERFDLVLRREKRSMPVYALRVRSSGAKRNAAEAFRETRLTPVEDRAGMLPAPGGMTFQGMTMAEFTREFFAHLPSIDRPVIDETGLEGRFAFTLRVFDRDLPPGELKPAVLAGGPELFIHALEQVGLTLARETRSVDVVVVDSGRSVPAAD
jgi:uncharacterized protein (TIGR03435 family)